MFSDGGFSSPDIFLALSIIFVALISISLNPFVFKHNYFKKKSIARDLYLTLSAQDFISSLVLSVNFATGVIRPKEAQCATLHNTTFCETNYYKYVRKATFTEKIVGCWVWFLISTPNFTTCILAICRWYQISFPLRFLKRRTAGVLLAVFWLFQAIILPVTLLNDSPDKPTMMAVRIQTAWNFRTNRLLKDSKLQFEDILVTSLTSIALLASILTIRTIVKSQALQENEERRRKKIKSTLKIGVLNLGNFAFIGVLLSLVLSETNRRKYLILQTICTLLPILQSSLNPVVYTLMTNSVFNSSS